MAGFSLRQLRDVSIADLLGREPVKLDTVAIGRFLEDRRVVVTGAGGSIGSEICRQVLRFRPAKLVMLDNAETPLFFLNRELLPEHGERIHPQIGDVTNRALMDRIFAEHKPDVVIHAAAYKHVPMMEAHPLAAVRNNVGGTKVVAELAAKHGVGSFVLISTDKAVNPTSVMGATKRVAEKIVHSFQGGETRYCAVRFGNVLGSNGSVVPIFREQIEGGGPLTVTHPEMTRYFMTIPEASQLVLQAAALGEGGELFILDMGEPVKIAELARDMVRLSGLDDDEIEIIFTGPRPGEKLFEELALDRESVDSTLHQKIFVARGEQATADEAERVIADSESLLEVEEARAIRRLLFGLVPEYADAEPDNVIEMPQPGESAG